MLLLSCAFSAFLCFFVFFCAFLCFFVLFCAFLCLWNLIIKKNKKFKTVLITSTILLLTPWSNEQFEVRRECKRPKSQLSQYLWQLNLAGCLLQGGASARKCLSCHQFFVLSLCSKSGRTVKCCACVFFYCCSRFMWLISIILTWHAMCFRAMCFRAMCFRDK